MKLFYLLFICFSMTSAVMAQESWKVTLNDKTVLNATTEDEEKNSVIFKPSDLKKKKDFIVKYIEKDKKNDWERVIVVYDETDHELTKQKGAQLKIKNSALHSLFKNTKKIKLYTWALPTDPKLKAVIRIRRVHLCTLVLQ